MDKTHRRCRNPFIVTCANEQVRDIVVKLMHERVEIRHPPFGYPDTGAWIKTSTGQAGKVIAWFKAKDCGASVADQLLLMFEAASSVFEIPKRRMSLWFAFESDVEEMTTEEICEFERSSFVEY